MAYSAKKSAQSRALKDYGPNYADLCNFVETDEGWEIKLKDDEPQAPAQSEQQPESPVAENSSEDEPNELPSERPGMFSTMVGLMTGAVAAPQAPETTAPTSNTGLKIEKDRPEQNGVKRPSAGGLCRAVWDACWEHQERTDTVPTAKDVKAIAEANGWNPNNASIEYYQWRKYNGIQGRVAKPATVEQSKAE